MTFNLSKYKDKLLFLPLGGAGEIGMNVYLYHYQGKWLMVDFGIGFADESLPGVDITVPDLSFIMKYTQDLAGLILTHAHEDHHGAIQYLWRELGCPIYATRFTASVLKAKLAGMGLNFNVPIQEVESQTPFNIGPFELEIVGLTHSIPEMHGIVIKTDIGNIFHTGDWKFDHNPLVGNTSDEKALKKLGKEGVLAMIGDSTNIFSEGVSGSEGDLQKSLQDLMADFKDSMIIISTFASNVARLFSIAQAAETHGRKVALVGRSLWRMYESAKECGYFQGCKPFLTDSEIKQYKRNEILAICTGCQGEPLAATGKLAYNNHPKLKLLKGDVVIFSSKIIPGNEKRIFGLFNQFCKNGVEVLTEKDHFVHVSGHPSRDEVAKMYKIIKPKIAIPVHGEAMHIHEHAKFALQHGAKQALEIENGDVIEITAEKAEKVGEVFSGCMAIDGNYIVPYNSSVLRMRRKMRDNGMIIVTLIVDTKGKLVTLPLLTAPGVLDDVEDQDFIASMIEEISQTLNRNSRKADSQYIRQTARTIINRSIKAEVGKDTNIIVQLERI